MDEGNFEATTLYKFQTTTMTKIMNIKYVELTTFRDKGWRSSGENKIEWCILLSKETCN